MPRSPGNFVDYGKPPKEKKPKSGVKLIQSVQIDWDLAKTLVKAGAMKHPTVPKMEAMEKWILAHGWDLSIEHDKATGLTVSTIVCPGLDDPLTFTGSDATMALATAKAIGEAYTLGPKQASFLGDSGDDAAEPDRPAKPDKRQTSFVDVEPGEEATSFNDDGVDSVDVENMAGEVVERIDDMLSQDAPDGVAHDNNTIPDDWRFLFQVDPADRALWEASPPADSEGVPYVVFDDGDSGPDRGWYLDPICEYDHKAGTITDETGDGVIVWTRAESKPSQPAESNPAVDFVMADIGKKPVKTPKVSNTTAAQADALNAAGVAVDELKA